MSTSAVLGNAGPSSSQSLEESRTRKSLRVWPAVVLIALFWAALYADHNVAMWMFPRFISRIAAYLILILAFIAWWLTRSAIPWRDRLLAIVVMIATAIVAGKLADPSMGVIGVLMNALPIAFTAWTIWLLASRSLSPLVQRVGFCVAMTLSFGFFTLMRMNGVDAAQDSELSWRWTPTKEQEFLGSRVSTRTGPASNAAPAKSWAPQPGEWLELRGSLRDGIVTGAAIDADWTAHPPKEMWRQKIGPGWSSLIVVDGRLVTQEQRGDFEVVSCYEAATGREIWAHQDKIRFEESLAGAGPRGTPTFADGRIYTLGATGLLNCLDTSGSVVWSHDIVKDAGVPKEDQPQWGFTSSPLVVDGLVIVYAGGSEKSTLAYHAADGKLAWTRAGGKQSYSSPQVATLAGQKQIVMHDNRALFGLNIADGALLWEHPNASQMSLPMLQPHATSGDCLVDSSDGTTTLFDIKRDGDKWTAAPRWVIKNFLPDFSDFVIQDGCIYGLSDGVLCCVNLSDGKRLWKKGRLGHGQVLSLAEQKLLMISNDKGEIILIFSTRDGYTELGRVKVIEGKTWSSPVVAGGRVFLRNAEEIAAFELAGPVPSGAAK